MTNRLLTSVTLALCAWLSAVPAHAQPLNLANGEYDITLYGCLNAGSTCKGSMTITNGIFTGIFVGFGSGNGSVSSVNQLTQTTKDAINFSMSGGGLFWGALGYYQGPLTFLPKELMTWGVLGYTTQKFEISGPVIGLNPDGSPRYGPDNTVYQEVVTGAGGWASITRIGDVPPPPPTEPVYLGDIRNLVLPSILDSQTGGPLAIPQLQTISPTLLNTMANVIRADDRTVEVPVRFADPVAVPEPSTVALLTAGLAGLVAARRRRRQRVRWRPPPAATPTASARSATTPSRAARHGAP